MNGKYFTSFDGTKIYYHKKEKDEGKWLIFLHGFGGDLTAWQKERDYFAKLGISTIAMDLRGHGLSERSDRKQFYNLENFAKDLEMLLQQEEIKNYVTVGHCFGGMVAIFFQAKLPNQSKGLILIDTSYKPPFIGNSPVSKILLRYIFDLFSRLPNLQTKGHADFNQFVGTSDLDITRILSDMLHTSLKSYLTICQTLAGLDAEKLLDQISVPTLVVQGTKDTIFPPDVAKYLHKRIKKSELDLIEGANHIIVINNPKELEASLEKFLKKINFLGKNF
ncbi:alpha/beta hydrolase [Candidatus Daviesbacteria bacterium]|nr:alpha/beta hydrolase [Candidatus Daviesbacteria bacterium]